MFGTIRIVVHVSDVTLKLRKTHKKKIHPFSIKKTFEACEGVD